jgi:hypothetical protein
MTAFEDVYPHVELLPEPRPDRNTHRGSTVSGGHPLMSNPGTHVRERWPVWPYLVAVLGPLALVLLILVAVRLFAPPSSTAELTPANVSVAPSACVFADGS